MQIPWGLIFGNWPNVVTDLAQFYSVHWHQILDWPWPVIRGYVEGLFIEPGSRVYRLYIAPRLPKRG